MRDLWNMTVADRRWWINQTIDHIRKQNEANQKAASGKSNTQSPDKIKAARNLIHQHQQLSSG